MAPLCHVSPHCTGARHALAVEIVASFGSVACRKCHIFAPTHFLVTVEVSPDGQTFRECLAAFGGHNQMSLGGLCRIPCPHDSFASNHAWSGRSSRSVPGSLGAKDSWQTSSDVVSCTLYREVVSGTDPSRCVSGLLGIVPLLCAIRHSEVSWDCDRLSHFACALPFEP